MTDNTWFMNIEKKVLTRLKYEMESQLLAEYPTLDVSNQIKPIEEANFPSVVLITLPFAEIGNDLVNQTVNAVISGFQIEVTVDTTQTDANRIVGVALDIMKSMGFSINALPELSTVNNLKISVMRCKRVVGSGDTI